MKRPRRGYLSVLYGDGANRDDIVDMLSIIWLLCASVLYCIGNGGGRHDRYKQKQEEAAG